MCARARACVCVYERARVCVRVCVTVTGRCERYHQSVIHWRECIIIYINYCGTSRHASRCFSQRGTSALTACPSCPKRQGQRRKWRHPRQRPVSGSTGLRGGCGRQIHARLVNATSPALPVSAPADSFLVLVSDDKQKPFPQLSPARKQILDEDCHVLAARIPLNNPVTNNGSEYDKHE